MKSCFSLCLFVAAAGAGLGADVPAPANPGARSGDAASLSEQVRDLRETVARLQTEYQQNIATLTAQVQRQQQVIDALAAGSSHAGASSPPSMTSQLAAASTFPTTDDSVVAVTPEPALSDRGGAPSTNASSFPTTDDTLVGTAPAVVGEITRPSRGSAGGRAAGSYMDVSFDAVATFAGSTSADLANLEVGDHDPQQRGFNLRNQELALAGAVDPYFEGAANIVFKLDNFNETSTEVEEAFLQTTSLPAGLQFKAGQFFSPFGRINPTHPHTWDFADAPLAVGRFLGPDGLRGAGAQLSWLAPWPWYSQFILAIQNGRGGTAYSFRNPGEDGGLFLDRPTIDRDVRGLSDFVWTGRWENSVDLSPTQTVVLGGSLALGPNDTGTSSSTRLYGLDFLYKWKPRDAFGGWPFLKSQTEIFWRRFEAGRGANDAFPAAEVFDDRGLYSQLVWGFTKQWTVGVRADWLDHADSTFTSDLTRQDRTRGSAALTWYPTEFSKLRLQFNHDWLKADIFRSADSEESIFLQTEFVLGAHGAHKF